MSVLPTNAYFRKHYNQSFIYKRNRGSMKLLWGYNYKMIILKHCDIPINRESYLNIKQHYIHRWAHIFKIEPIEKSERQVSNRFVKSMSKNLRLWWTQMVCNFKLCHLSDTKCRIEMLNTFRMINRWKSTSYMFNRPITASNPELLPHNRPLLTCLQYYTTHSIPWIFSK